MSIRDLYDELKKGLTHPVYFISSGDPYLLKEALFSVKNTVPEAERDFLFHTFDMESPDPVPPPEQILDVLNTVPFFSGGRKVVAIENAQKLQAEGMKTLSGYVAKPSPDSVLLILYAGTPRKNIGERLKGAKSISLAIRERDLPYWVKEKAARKGLTLTPAAVDYLIGTIGTDAGLLSSEVEKLSLSGKERLDRDDIADIVRGSGDYDVFDLINALRAGDANRVFGIYGMLSETQEPFGLLGALNWHYTKSGGSGSERARIFELLHEADTMVKTGKNVPMEYFLTRLLGTDKAHTSGRKRNGTS